MGEETKKALLADLDKGATPAYKEAEIHKTMTGRFSSSAPNFQDLPWTFTTPVKNQMAFYNEVLGHHYQFGQDIHQSAHPYSCFVRENSCVLAPVAKFEWRSDNFDCQHCEFAEQCKEGMLAVRTLSELKDICGEYDGGLCYGPDNEICAKCALRKQCEHLHFTNNPSVRPPDQVQVKREQAKLISFLSTYSEAPGTMAGRSEQELDRIAAEYEANVEEKKRRDLQRVHAQLRERGFPTAPITVAKHAGRRREEPEYSPGPPLPAIRQEMDIVEREAKSTERIRARLERAKRSQLEALDRGLKGLLEERLAKAEGTYVEPKPDRSGEEMIKAFRDFVVEPLITKRRG